ncbi:MAG: hypothetical protein QOF99_409 [Pseudonocardiales bacterium]|jgi:hypothetical protein|nr:hypothetical protein [Pseudonocardiales bacterium]
MSSDDPREKLPAVSIWAVPGLVDDPDNPEVGLVPLLTVVPSIAVSTSDDYPGADSVDVIVTELLGRGFGLLVSPEVGELSALLVLRDASAALHGNGTLLRITDRDVALYDGELGPTPQGWHACVRRRSQLVVLVSSAIDLYAGDRVEQIAAAGAVVGAQVPMVANPSGRD